MTECGNSDSSDQRAAFDELFEALADAHRRYVISFLSERDGSVTVSDLTRNICNRQSDSFDGKPLDADHVYLALYHCHLRKLADANCIEFDSEEKTVSPGDRFPEFSATLHKLQL